MRAIGQATGHAKPASGPGQARDCELSDADAQRPVLYRIDWEASECGTRLLLPRQAGGDGADPARARAASTGPTCCCACTTSGCRRQALTAAGALVVGLDRELIPPDTAAYLPG